MRAALLLDDNVVNVIEYKPEVDYDPTPYELVPIEEGTVIGPGWTRQNESFSPPSVHDLFGNPLEIPSDGETPAIVTYVNTTPTAPSEVEFDVNGVTTAVILDDGVAQLEVTASQPDTVIITCDGLKLYITAVEV